ncbi:MAG: molybdenum ABC transporter permease subunit [Elusimicrobia bacterium RIFOXYB2_FULL_50_12]|nr:MAG: molybdenum ABC transporter permease subunit [Elusimicrobia bacterium RIFOXYB2_FULL_50_12]
MAIEFTPFLVSLRLSFTVTALVMAVAMPVAYRLAFSRSRWKFIAESVLTLPLVMPPTVLGFYMLLAFSRNSPPGRIFSDTLGLPLVFSFSGIVAVSCIYSFPFALQPLKAGFESLDRAIIEASYTLGKSKLETFVSVVLPNIRPSLVTAVAMCFAHTMGEFGAILMIGGNIPGVTRVASIAVYDKVEQLDYFPAHVYSVLLLALGISVLMVVHHVNRRRGERHDTY